MGGSKRGGGSVSKPSSSLSSGEAAADLTSLAKGAGVF